MKKTLLILLISPILSMGQSNFSLTVIYSQAIGDFIKAANQKNKTNFDTLFFGKRVNGQPDDFPEIKLPGTIEKTQIRVISPELGKIKQKERPSRTYINLIGWVNKDAEFIFVVFSNGFEHQYDYTLNYKYNTEKKVFELNKVQFTDQPNK